MFGEIVFFFSVIKFCLKEKLMREIIYNFYKNIFIIKSVLIYLIVIGGWSLFMKIFDKIVKIL